MRGNVIGGKKSAEKNKKKDPDFYKKIGSLGGRKTAESGQLIKVGFASDRQRAIDAGRAGGLKSRRSSKK